MPKVSVLEGVVASQYGDLLYSYPRNCVAVPNATGVENVYIRPAPGISHFGQGPGADRLGTIWNGVVYRVMGTSLVRVNENGTVDVIGYVGPGGYTTFDNSSTQLAVNTGGRVYLYDGTTLRQIVDPDLGYIISLIWINGYFLCTDGEYLVQTNILDPFVVNPADYGTSEIDPDPVLKIIKLRNEAYVLNRYTTEVFRNVVKTGFSFQRVEGAQIQKGCIGTFAACEFIDSVAFVGGGKNNGKSEPLSVYLGYNSEAVRISTITIDTIINSYSESVLQNILVESVVTTKGQQLYIHLPDKTLVFDYTTTQALGFGVWSILNSGVTDDAQYRGFGFVYAYGKLICADRASNNIGFIDESVITHFGEKITWDFTTKIQNNDMDSALVPAIELKYINWMHGIEEPCIISTQFSEDGVRWSQMKYSNGPVVGNSQKRIVFTKNGIIKNYRVQKFSGESDCKLTFLCIFTTFKALKGALSG